MLTASAFLFVFGLGCLLALFRHPIFGLVTYVGVFYVHPPSFWWGSVLPSLRWSLIAAAVTLLSVLVHRSKVTGPGLRESGLFRGLVLFVLWLAIQMFWALDETMHTELLVLTTKYAVLVFLIYKCINSIRDLRIFLWSHAIGCFYVGYYVFSQYVGGRFEGFISPGIDEANAGALHIATGILITFVLFLSGKLYEKIAAIGIMPFIVNALIASISRSGFLALGAAGLVFNLFTPKKLARVVRVFSLVGLVLFIVLTNQSYWERIGTILVAGEEVEGVDTGSGRLVLMKAQLQMFSNYPLGCGHRCTAVLSPLYLDEKHLTGPEERKARSSHNTFMTLLVEQGIPGVVIYIALMLWIVRMVFRLRHRMRQSEGLLATTYAATVAILAAITVGDQFVDYLKFEARFWFIALLLVLVKLDAASPVIETDDGAICKQAASQ
ncbi:MAG: O-antigen ligase family protein [Gammaproteobacteria bacterium]|nr:O-antigen ligase family protein [Gammaproteobacteria bacterium]